MSNRHTIRVVIFKDGEFFIASAVDFDIAAQGKSIEKALASLRIVMHAEIDERRGDLSEVGPAPDMIRQMYDGNDKSVVLASLELLAA